MRLVILILTVLACTAVASAQYVETNHLIGVHWPDDQNANGGVAASPQYTDLELMLGDSGGPLGSSNFAGDGGAWVLDIAMTDVDGSPFYQWAWQGGAFGPTNKSALGYIGFAIRRATTGGKNHTPIVRIGPAYGRNVPHSGDPYTLAHYASDAQSLATLLKDLARYYVVGNEANLNGENNRYTGPSSGGEFPNDYSTPWQPTPEQYGDTYVSVRDAMHGATTGAAGTAVALMQPVSPGLPIAGTRYMDGYDYLWRQIKQVNTLGASKLDGFAIHAYGAQGAPTPATNEVMNTIKEQLCIISQLGHGNKPVFLTEWNMDMWVNPGNTTETVQTQAASFIKQTLSAINTWNQGSGGLIPGVANTNITSTNWFVYPGSGVNQADGWNRMSLKFWKDKVASPNDTNNSWYAFQNAASQRYTAGAKGVQSGGNITWPASGMWWRDDFDGAALDTTPSLPDWDLSTADSGTVTVANGVASFKGNGTQFGNALVETGGYVFGDCTMQIRFLVANGVKSGTTSPEANFDIRIGGRGVNSSYGYSLTFFSSQSPDRPNHVVLRRTGAWTTVGSFDATVAGGINTGDTFEVRVLMDNGVVNYKVYKNEAATPAIDWNVTETDAPRVGRFAFGSYGINQVDVQSFAVGGKLWNYSYSPAAAKDWELY